MSKKLLFILLIATIVRLPWILCIPSNEAPDEYAHAWVIQYMGDHLSLPPGQVVFDTGAKAVYGSLPQLGYLTHVVMSKLHPCHSAILNMRLGSLLLGLIAVWMAYLIGIELFPNKKVFAFALPMLVAFHPQFVFVNSYTNNDVAACAAASVIIYWLIIALKGRLTWRLTLVIGVLTSLLALSKYSGLSIIPAIVFALFAACHLNNFGFKKTLLYLICFFGLVFVLTSWWFLRSYQEFHGDWLGTKTMYYIWASSYHKLMNYYIPITQILVSKRWWRFLFFSFWGMFGYTNKYIWRPLYFVYLAFMIGALIGWIKVIYSRIKLWYQRSSANKQELVAPTIWLTFALCLFCNLMAAAWASTINLGGPQGRYLFASEIPIMALIIFGLSKLDARISSKLTIAFLFYNALVCLGSWLMLFSMYVVHF